MPENRISTSPIAPQTLGHTASARGRQGPDQDRWPRHETDRPSGGRWKRRPTGANWGDFGPDDQLGRLNLLTPDMRRRAAAEIREGLAFSLSLPLDYPGGNKLNPYRHPPKLGTVPRGSSVNYNHAFSEDDQRFLDIVSDDFVTLFTQYSTQWDGLSHIGQEFDVNDDGKLDKVYYNGYRAGEHVRGPADSPEIGAVALGIENMAASGVQGRGVLVDLFRHFGRARRHVGYDDFLRILDTEKIDIEAADMLCLYTGFADVVLEMRRDPDPQVLSAVCAELDGRDGRLLNWISDSGVSVIVSDNYGIEAHPSRDGEGERFTKLPLHELCLFKLGIHLGELWYLTELAAWLREHGRYRFFLTAPPLRLPGAVGSPVNPVATV